MQSSCVLLCWHLWHIRLYHIFPHYPINGTIFKNIHSIKKNLRLVVSTKSVRKISHSGKKSAKCYHKFTQIFTQTICYFCQVLMKIELYRYIFDKYSDFIFHENPSTKRSVVLCRQTWQSYWSLFAILRKAPKKKHCGFILFLIFLLSCSSFSRSIPFFPTKHPFEVIDAPVSPSRSLDSNLGPETE
jgi:hypothetical protein